MRKKTHAISSKEISEEENKVWEEQSTEVMKELLWIKSESCQEFHQTLIQSGSNILAEATRDTFWGTGLDMKITTVTKPEYWPGANQLGVMLMDLRNELIGPQDAQGRQTEAEEHESEEKKEEQEDKTEEPQKPAQPASNTKPKKVTKINTIYGYIKSVSKKRPPAITPPKADDNNKKSKISSEDSPTSSKEQQHVSHINEGNTNHAPNGKK